MAWEQVAALAPEVAALRTAPDALEQVILEAKYGGYIQRQAAQAERFH